jgi:hypothetical protein
MKYAVEQKIYDTGKVHVKVSKCDDNEESFSEEMSNYDLYFDVFDTREKAEEFRKEAIEA